ncbi:MAG: DNA polymerase/3'-5' exonuclease PolX [Candidatus Undinarchaeales archaeon]
MAINRELARIFREIADILELKETKWEPRAYRKAAYNIENLGDSVKDIYKKGGTGGLKEIPGVGKALAAHIEEYIKTGEIKKLAELRKDYSKEVTELVNIEGLGSKKVKKLKDKLGVSSAGELKKAAEKHKIRKLEGFGEKTEENILESLEFYKKRKGRMFLDQAIPLAEEIISYLKENSPVQEIDYVGSLRRMKETIGDIDILVISDKADKVINTFTKMDSIRKIISQGSTRSSIALKEDDIHVDLRVIEKSSYGAALIYFTGSKEHNIELRKLARKKGYKLSEYGLFKRKNNEKLKSETEDKIYKKLGLSYIPPEIREHRGEINSAKKDKIPKLVELKDIKGDLQMHTDYSDGSETVEEMIKGCSEQGYKYMALTDHSKSQRIASGLSKKEFENQFKEIEKASKKYDIKVFKGGEIDILKDGSLDFEDKFLKKLDIVVGAVHSNFKMSEKEMTDRILKALDNKYLDILAHPTGRIMGKRKGYDADFDKIFEKAGKNEKIIEINAQPQRLDINNSLILSAKEYDVKFSIDTDAHHISSLNFMKYGVGQARRGWLEKQDVVNTYSLKKLKKMFKRI